MSTEESAKPGLVRMSETVNVGGVKLRSGSMLRLKPDDFYFGEDWTETGLTLLEVTRVGRLLKGDTFVYVEGYQHLGTVTRARAVAVKIEALREALIETCA